MKNQKKYKFISISVAVTLILSVTTKKKKEIIIIFENLYNKYIKNIDVVVPVNNIVDLDLDINNIVDNIIENNESLNDCVNEKLKVDIENNQKVIESDFLNKAVIKEEVTESKLEEELNDSSLEQEMQKELKQVALTFDDGPSIYTEELLEILKENNARATFFVVGSRIKEYGYIIKKIKEEGHQIGSHGSNHEDFTKMSSEELKQILEETKHLLKQYNVTQTIVRPPYGSVNNNVKKNVEFPLIMWSIDTRDWEHRNSEKGVEIILENIEDGSIILMHDLYKPTIDIVKHVLPILNEKGYEFVTIEELFDETELERGKTYYKKIK